MLSYFLAGGLHKIYTGGWNVNLKCFSVPFALIVIFWEMKNILRIWGKYLGVRDSLWFPKKRVCLFRRNRHASIDTHTHTHTNTCTHCVTYHHLSCHPNPHLLTLQYKSKTKDRSWLWGKRLEVFMFASSFCVQLLNSSLASSEVFILSISLASSFKTSLFPSREV